jgi:hypothetical protein
LAEVDVGAVEVANAEAGSGEMKSRKPKNIDEIWSLFNVRVQISDGKGSSMTATDGKAHKVEPALMVVDVQHMVEDCMTVDTAHENVVVAEFGAVQPSVGVERKVDVEQEVVTPEGQAMAVIVAGAVEHSLDNELEEVCREDASELGLPSPPPGGGGMLGGQLPILDPKTRRMHGM